MGRLIVSAQMTMDCVMDRLEGWFDPWGEAREHGLAQPRRRCGRPRSRDLRAAGPKYLAGGRRVSQKRADLLRLAQGPRRGGVSIHDRPRERTPPGAPRPSEAGRRALSDRTKILRISPR